MSHHKTRKNERLAISNPLSIPVIMTGPGKAAIEAKQLHISNSPQELSVQRGNLFYFLKEIEKEGSIWFEVRNVTTRQTGMVPKLCFEDPNKDHVAIGYMSPLPSPQFQHGHHHQTVFATVLYKFVAERSDELDVDVGEHVSILAYSKDREWFIAKPIVRLSPPGLVPIAFVKVGDPTTGKPIRDLEALLDRGDLPSIEEWKGVTSVDSKPARIRKISSKTNGRAMGAIVKGDLGRRGAERSPPQDKPIIIPRLADTSVPTTQDQLSPKYPQPRERKVSDRKGRGVSPPQDEPTAPALLPNRSVPAAQYQALTIYDGQPHKLKVSSRRGVEATQSQDKSTVQHVLADSSAPTAQRQLPLKFTAGPKQNIRAKRPTHPWERQDCEDFQFLLNEQVFHPNELGITSQDYLSFSQYVTKDWLAITSSDKVTIFNFATKGIRELKWPKESSDNLLQGSSCIISPDGDIVLRQYATGRIEATEIRTKQLISVLPDRYKVGYYDIKRAHWGNKNTVYIPAMPVGCIIRWSFREVDPVAVLQSIQPMELVTRHQCLDVFVTSDESWWVALGTTRAGLKIDGRIQLHDAHNEESKLLPGLACCIFETKVYDEQTALLIRADRTSDSKLSLQVHSLTAIVPGKQQFEPVDVSIDISDATDTPLQVFALDPLPIVAVITARCVIYFFEVHTGTLLYEFDSPKMKLDLLPMRHQWPGGKWFCCRDKDGALRRLSVNEKDLIGWVRRVLRDDTLASAIAIRTGLPGAEDVVLDDMFRNYRSVS